MAPTRALLSLMMSLAMMLNVHAPITPKQEGVLLSVSILSDTHIDARLPLGRLLLARALDDISAGGAVDAAVVAGDMTNYGDGESLHAFYELFDKHCGGPDWVIAPGNHDIGHVEDVTQQAARQRLIDTYNAYTGADTNHIYYSISVNGFRFIVLGDQSDDSWDIPDIGADQLAFLDAQLAEATANGKPAFVVCHWPVEGANGQSVIWEDGSMGSDNSVKVRAVLEKYSNVFFISGHVHTGINGKLTQTLFGFSCVEKKTGVTYVNLPTFLLVNRYGIPWGGMGFQMEVYECRVLFRARNYLTSKWYPLYEYAVPLQ
ncbi:MAG TPA: metallophosphoesterase [Clostridiales bacterium]|nr:metallophosphoesterase [Clostridiales bacterium]HQK73748.1 metallophosphoesterase [Clostridiales bacterium]